MNIGYPIPADQFHSKLDLRFVGVQPKFPYNNNTNRFPGPPPLLDRNLLRQRCPLLKEVTDPANQAKTPEPLWRIAMAFAAFMSPEDGEAWAQEISEHDPVRYSEAAVAKKLAQIRALDPTKISAYTCARMGADYITECGSDICSTCSLKGKIHSPAAVAHKIVLAPDTVMDEQEQKLLQIPPPPEPYVRTKDGIGIKITDPATQLSTVHIFCPNDMYPLRISLDDERFEEPIIWNVHFRREGWNPLSIPMVGKHKLWETLARRGIAIFDPDIPYQHHFMTAYTRHLRDNDNRLHAFTKLGFNSNRDFRLGNLLYKSNGDVQEHVMSDVLIRATRGGIAVAGDYDVWRNSVGIYSIVKEGLEPYRCYMYSSFASILFHMTGLKATVVCGSGATGRGKTTLIEACASVWGDPSLLKGYGGPSASTQAAAEARFDAMHHLPMFIDEITEKDPKALAELIFSYSSGVGKERSQSAGGMRKDVAHWANILLLTGNQDEYERLAGVRQENRQHAVRLTQLEFNEYSGTIITKAQGTELRKNIATNFGWAGHYFVREVVKHYDEIKKRIERVIKSTDTKINSPSEERYWVAWKACCQVAAEICHALWIFPTYPISHDIYWMEQQLIHIRNIVADHEMLSNDILSEFLDVSLPNTLIISSASSNINNVAREPRGELLIRHDMDTNQCTVAIHAFRKYCLEQKINMGNVMIELSKRGMLLSARTQRVLGLDTPFSSGRVTCFVIDTQKLAGAPALVASNPGPVIASPAAAAQQAQQKGTALQRAAQQWQKGSKI
jgi:uncharacterized protein (DUF927 family)